MDLEARDDAMMRGRGPGRGRGRGRCRITGRGDKDPETMQWRAMTETSGHSERLFVLWTNG